MNIIHTDDTLAAFQYCKLFLKFQILTSAEFKTKYEEGTPYPLALLQTAKESERFMFSVNVHANLPC